MRRTLTRFITVITLSLMTAWSFAQNQTTVGAYQINHIAFNSTFLSSDIAALYGIKRAKNNAVINISVQDMNNGGKGVALTSIKGEVKNLFQQTTFLEFDQVVEEPALYYIGEYRFGNEDAVTFTVDVLLPGEHIPTTVKWQQTLHQQ